MFDMELTAVRFCNEIAEIICVQKGKEKKKLLIKLCLRSFNELPVS